MAAVSLVVLLIGVGAAEKAFTEQRWNFLAFGVMFAGVGVIALGTAYSLFRQNRFPDGLPSPRMVQLEGEPATFIPRWQYPVWEACAYTIVLASAPVAWVVLGILEGNWGIVALLTIPGIWLLSFPVFVARGRFVAGGVWLTPTRIVHRCYSAYASVRWEDITGLGLGATRGFGAMGLEITADRFEQRSMTPTFKSRPFLRKDRIVVEVDFLHPGPVATMLMLQNLLEDPAARAELGTEASLDRLAHLSRVSENVPPRPGEPSR